MTTAVPFRGAALLLRGALFFSGCAAGIGPAGHAGDAPAPGPEVVIPAGLRAEIDAGSPVILLVDPGVRVWSRPHSLLVSGCGLCGYVAHSGRTAAQAIPASDLAARWAKMGRPAIVARGAAR